MWPHAMAKRFPYPKQKSSYCQGIHLGLNINLSENLIILHWSVNMLHEDGPRDLVT